MMMRINGMRSNLGKHVSEKALLFAISIFLILMAEIIVHID